MEIEAQQTRLEQFEDETNILPKLVVKLCMEEAGLSKKYHSWFAHHAVTRLLFMYTFPKWQKKFRQESGRDLVYNFVNHWIKAYKQDKDFYVKQHFLKNG
jgi:hypothetical protein